MRRGGPSRVARAGRPVGRLEVGVSSGECGAAAAAGLQEGCRTSMRACLLQRYVLYCVRVEAELGRR